MKSADRAKRKSADKKSKRDTVASHESEETRKKGEIRERKKEKGNVPASMVHVMIVCRFC